LSTNNIDTNTQFFQINASIYSHSLEREVIYDIYSTGSLDLSSNINLLLINDGQDLHKMNLKQHLLDFMDHEHIKKLVCVGIHAGPDRKQEYGVAGFPDYLQRGDRAGQYHSFLFSELIPHVKRHASVQEFHEKYLLGFSLGGLMAFDVAMDHPMEFNAVGVFSGSFWWRSTSLDAGYIEQQHRIMHNKVRTKKVQKKQKFFFQTGKLDELSDRNNNGIIDSIDDTIDLICELENIGYQGGTHISYLELEDGKHDVETWSRVIPEFLKWLKPSE
jgi:enterochelin esterase-like enzyme